MQVATISIFSYDFVVTAPRSTEFDSVMKSKIIVGIILVHNN